MPARFNELSISIANQGCIWRLMRQHLSENLLLLAHCVVRPAPIELPQKLKKAVVLF